MEELVEAPPQDSLTAAIRERRSIRRYRKAPLPEGLVGRLIEAASWAPSPHNRQPWRFVLIEAPAARRRLAEAMAARLRADRLADGDDPAAVERDAARSIERIVSPPALVLACLSMRDMDRYPDARRAEAERMMAAQSVAMAVQNLLLLAHAHGLGSCWMCAPLFCPDTVAGTLSLPPEWVPQALVTLGFPDGPSRRRERLPLSEILVDRGI